MVISFFLLIFELPNYVVLRFNFINFMYLPEWVQKYKEPRTEIKKVGGYFYKYQVEYRYNKEKQRTDKITVGLLGKITEQDGFIPSEKHLLKEKAKRSVDPTKVDIKAFGVYGLFSELLEEEIQGMKTVFESEDLEVLLSVAMMRFAHEAPIKRMQQLHHHDYCSLFWHNKALTDKTITNTLRYIGENRQLILEWMKSRIPVPESLNSSEKEYIMIDSTHITTTSNHLHVNAPGYNPARNFDEQIRLMYMFACGIKEPVYYRMINGNINDVSSMRLCLAEMSTNNVIYVADKGFYSKLNIDMLNDNNLQYIIPLYRNNKLTDFSPLKQSDFKKNNKFFVYEKRVIWYYSYQKEGQKFTTFLDEKLRVEEEEDYISRMGTHPEKYDKEGFDNKLHSFGTLTLTTNVEIEPQELYENYKQRNEIEVMFNSYKNFLNADRMYMQDRWVLEGWLAANFIAMIAYYKLYVKIKEAKLLSKYSPKDIIEISKSIFKIKINDQWHTTETTKKIRELLEKINIDYLKRRS